VLIFDLDQLKARMEVADDGNPVDSCIILPLLPGRKILAADLAAKTTPVLEALFKLQKK
jgi:hypothetical protein